MLDFFGRKTHNKQFVISDIHGCVKTFRALVEKIGLRKEDELYLLGDYIDRGPDSKGVVDFILKLQEEGYNVIALRGNHEEEFQFCLKDDRLRARHLKYYPKNNIFDKKYVEFFSSLPWYVELKKHWLVHAGFDFSKPRITDNTSEMCMIRNWEEDYDKHKAKGKTIVHGHTVTELYEIEDAIAKRKPVIPLDNGCVFRFRKAYGRLLCLELQSYELVWQENIDPFNTKRQF